MTRALNQNSVGVFRSRPSVNLIAVEHSALTRSDQPRPIGLNVEAIELLARRICGVGFAGVCLRSDDDKIVLSDSAREGPHASALETLAGQAILNSSLIQFNDVHTAPRSPRVDSDDIPSFRFSAGIPIMSPKGGPIGALCVLDIQAREKSLSKSELQSLQGLVAQIETLVLQQRAIADRDARLVRLEGEAEELLRVAEHDPLTALPNRALFSRRLNRAIAKSMQDQTPLALIMVDVDHFKQINDSMGHDAGDALLQHFAANLLSVIRSSDTAARIGGDEFAILLTEEAGNQSFMEAAKSLQRRLSQPIRHGGRMIECRASIGMAQFPADAASASELLKCSDLALAHAKLTRGCAVCFEPRLADDFKLRLEAVAAVEKALAQGELVPFYQPKVDLVSGRILGFEALMRRVRPDTLKTLPDPFDPSFADRDLAVRVGARMRTLILDDLKRWTDSRLPFGHVAINTCAADFLEDDFAETLLRDLEHRTLSPGVVEIEVTEGVFLGRGSAHVARALHALSDAGVRIALDDFGTGFASLSHLKQFPVDVLKIDRSFVAGIGKSADDAAIVRAVIGLGVNLGMEIVAEGIETIEQAKFVRMNGCSVGQGFLYGPAMPSNLVPFALGIMRTYGKAKRNAAHAHVRQ